MMLEQPISIQLKNVLYVPNFNACLLSTRRLSRDHGIGVHITPDKDYLSIKDEIVGQITSISDQYTIKYLVQGRETLLIAIYTNLKEQSKEQTLAV